MAYKAARPAAAGAASEPHKANRLPSPIASIDIPPAGKNQSRRRCHAPVLVLCRELIAAGCEPDTALHILRTATAPFRRRNRGAA
jgi:hypothetical protein